MFFRVKRTGKYPYLQIVESYRDQGHVRQRILATLGRLDLLQESGQLDSLIRSGARFCKQVAVIDAHNAGQTEPVSIGRIGPDLVLGRLWKETGIQGTLQDLLKARRHEFDVERAVYLTVLHRLLSPGSDRSADRWRESYVLPGTKDLDLHHLYRAMAWLGEPLEDSKSYLPGSIRCTKDLIEERLFERRRDLFSEIDLVFFDTTSIYFEGEGGQTLGQRGMSKDSRPDLKQMVVGLVLDAQGWPLSCELWPGNTADVTTLLPVVERMKKRFGVQQVSIVADRGMISKATVEALESGSMDCNYILGARMRSSQEVAETVIQDPGHFEEVVAQRKHSKDPSPLKVKDVRVGERRYVVCLNEEQRRKDEADRAAIVAHLRDQLRQGDQSLVGNDGYRKFLKTTPTKRFEVDEAKVEREARYDGKWVLRTNLEADAESVAHAYKQLWMVEAMFRTAKSVLDTRPIYHKRDETIRGHVFCSYLALVLKCELERRMRDKDVEFEWAEVMRGIDELQEVEAKFQGRRFLMRSKLVGQAQKAITAAGVALPPTLRELD